jgi:hypothetical protein
MAGLHLQAPVTSASQDYMGNWTFGFQETAKIDAILLPGSKSFRVEVIEFVSVRPTFPACENGRRTCLPHHLEL